MSKSEQLKWFYKVVRSIIFTSVALVCAIWVLLYVLLSLPPIQRYICNVAQTELSQLCNSRVEIGDVTIRPFNEVVIRDVKLYEPMTEKTCIEIDKVGAGISLWELVRHGKIMITYSELISPDIRITQSEEGSPLNIQFLIDAFAPKDKNKPPTKFDLRICNVVLRKGTISFDKLWCGRKPNDVIDYNHLNITSLSADVNIPRLSNEDMEFDLRRLAFILSPGLKVEKIASKVSVLNGGDIDVHDFVLQLEKTTLRLSGLTLPIKTKGGLKKWLTSETVDLEIDITDCVPSEFAAFYPALKNFRNKFDLRLQATGGLTGLKLNKLAISESEGDMSLNVTNMSLATVTDSLSRVTGLRNLEVEELALKSGAEFNKDLIDVFGDRLSEKVCQSIKNAGSVELRVSGESDLIKNNGSLNLLFKSGYGDFDMDALLLAEEHNLGKLKFNIATTGIETGRMLSIPAIGGVEMYLDGEAQFNNRIFEKGYLSGLLHSAGIPESKINTISSLIPSAEVSFKIPSAEINSYDLNDVSAYIEKEGNYTKLEIESGDKNLHFGINGEVMVNGTDSRLMLNGVLDKCRPGVLGLKGSTPADAISHELPAIQQMLLSGEFDIDLQGNNLDNLSGNARFSNLGLENLKNGKVLSLNKLDLEAGIENSGNRYYAVTSDWFAGEITGNFTPTGCVNSVQNIIARALPTFVPSPHVDRKSVERGDFRFVIFRNGGWIDYLNLPVNLLYEATITGGWNSEDNTVDLKIDAPYIQQGKDKLIQHTALNLSVKDGEGKGNIFSSIPTKKGILNLGIDLNTTPETANVGIHFNPGSNGAFYGDLFISASEKKMLNSAGKELNVTIHPSKIYLNQAEWDMSEAQIEYADKRIAVTGLSLGHGDQYINIGGVASPSLDDEVRVVLQDIDLNYVFDTLNIDVAQFGGNATGIAVGRGLLSKNMQAYTERLHVNDLSYNNCVLGDGDLKGDFDVTKKRVGIYADIHENGRYAATVDGGIWIGKDSLSFDFAADKVRVGFLQYFMKAFTSHVDGRASGKALLYGTFKDVNMKGRMLADSVAIKVDYSNVTYTGSDSIIIDPGKIMIPRFELHDVYGHKGYLSGILEHDNFHRPEFDFRITEADKLLLYNTNATINPVWYGKIFGSGTGRIVGNEEYIRLIADMTTEENSEFTFVLDDSKEAINYQFLTFTDRKKSMAESQMEVKLSEPDEIVKAFNRKIEASAGPPTVFAMDIRATITPSAKLTLVMDPVAGDKITARGEGSMNLGYSTESDELRMYGKYTLSEGTYNFSLQDLILKDFIIKDGSSISFNGDPMAAMLNIRGAYRVNTNLTDLDASFATDKDLNRVNVPVDAMLLVTGDLNSPDIKFDIELPTLNSEVEQKVRSIISSDDMMNMQMIYLLALNRFYTPDYSGNSNTGGEWASVASSTLSSQLQNILGQLTDKVTVAPSLRSDKGDFSDLQVDVALSSRLFNNRLLINGNFGYRDPSTSSTTFIGDFDIEYLLNRSGNFRLKAYNHFNDQNYYLKSALTTQGIGLVWRKDFDTLLPRRKKSEKSEKSEKSYRPDTLNVKQIPDPTHN